MTKSIGLGTKFLSRNTLPEFNKPDRQRYTDFFYRDLAKGGDAVNDEKLTSVSKT
ncbi:hypothetical protein [Pedobacter punctiformis]|uniref:Uncharacterized protein n=1 Tax=Pedobacter punctiformis TaxID=3004097 RepID=A0ABT4LA42_9SPHI|nr:hypothetical protein [Pedobacter sp. HCMS5-2]MCZ4244776.1 hypothetical protein [Pedobacter sp. HCMS5-2]